MPQVTLTAPDISCDHCIGTIRSTVEALPGVRFVSGDPEMKTVVLEHNGDAETTEAVSRAMEEAGYPVEE